LFQSKKKILLHKKRRGIRRVEGTCGSSRAFKERALQCILFGMAVGCTKPPPELPNLNVFRGIDALGNRATRRLPS